MEELLLVEVVDGLSRLMLCVDEEGKSEEVGGAIICTLRRLASDRASGNRCESCANAGSKEHSKFANLSANQNARTFEMQPAGEEHQNSPPRRIAWISANAQPDDGSMMVNRFVNGRDGFDLAFVVTPSRMPY
jgi:hypothetical protein